MALDTDQFSIGTQLLLWIPVNSVHSTRHFCRTTGSEQQTEFVYRIYRRPR